jgi:hypothetical protein
MGILITKKLAFIFYLTSFLAYSVRPVIAENKAEFNLADAFSSENEKVTENLVSGQEVEPIVVGREKWNEKEPSTTKKNVSINNTPEKTESMTIKELDPLETKQIKPNGINMDIAPPAIPPAVNLNRNFEGLLVLKPRTLGFEKKYPFQLENSRGKRLAFVDIENLKVVDPTDFENKQVNILGKLEPITKGKKDLVIRAKLLRRVD